MAQLRLTVIYTEALTSIQPERSYYPTVLDPLEQTLILRYLLSRCHTWSRLQTEGYILGPGTIRNKSRPSKGSIQSYQFRETPHAERQGAGTIRAIAIDCEMVGVRNGRQTLAFVSAIDFLTGDVLISRYVNPVEDVVDWRSQFSGVTQTIMTSAIASGAAFGSWREARDKLWEYMDQSTVLVGHSLNYDLEVLGMSHAKVVDSAILTAEAVFLSVESTKPLTRMWGLKTLAKDLLSLDIQVSSCGHSALEDAYAARDVIIWCIRNPDELQAWAIKARSQDKERKLAQRRQKYGNGRSKGKLSAPLSSGPWGYSTRDDNDYDDFRFSDLAEEFDWPEGYDPWSD
jgi:DNA polymerase III epsilon subunit-like protein